MFHGPCEFLSQSIFVTIDKFVKNDRVEYARGPAQEYYSSFIKKAKKKNKPTHCPCVIHKNLK